MPRMAPYSASYRVYSCPDLRLDLLVEVKSSMSGGGEIGNGGGGVRSVKREKRYRNCWC